MPTRECYLKEVVITYCIFEMFGTLHTHQAYLPQLCSVLTSNDLNFEHVLIVCTLKRGDKKVLDKPVLVLRI